MYSNKNSDSLEKKNRKRLNAQAYREFLVQGVKQARSSESLLVSQKEINNYGEDTGTDYLFGEELGASKLIEPASQGESLAVAHLESCSGHGASKRAKIAADLDPDARIRLLDNEIISTANVVSSSPSSLRNRFLEQYSVCPEIQRMKNDSQDQVLDSCETKVGRNLASFSKVASQTYTCYNVCVFCKCPGSHLFCNGKDCTRGCHVFCLNPLLKDAPLGLWYCPFCVQKKIKSGVHSVSEGMEFILDFKEEMQEEKHYLVKYKGLAHVHNRWIPESQMLLEAPKLVAEFNRKLQKGKVIRWKHEWAKPHRLLQKRYLVLPELADGCLSGYSNVSAYCRQEWLVKWQGLGYEKATWEFENSEFLCSPEGVALKKDYDRRREEAKKLSDPSKADKALLLKSTPLSKHSTLPDGCPPGLDKKYLNSINKLLEFWHMGRNAVLIDDEERIVKSILFILTLQSHTWRPYLIISAAASFRLWENEFTRLAPSVNVVVYNGRKDVRRMIQTVEFYDEGGRIMFQVLISHADAVIQDLEALYCIGWEAIIIDECQNSRISKHFEQFRNLSSDFRLLLFSGLLKDDLVDYLNTLSFLDPRGQENPVDSSKFDVSDDADKLSIVKERFSFYVAYECKANSKKFLEYWVPAQLSDVQLDQYCNILMSNSDALRSISKVDHVGALSGILHSARKCCDHPYLVDHSLASSLTKNLSLVEKSKFEVNASGKLRLLDKILQDIKTYGLRVVILFQSIDASGNISTGDILDDFLHQRYGAESYEHVIHGLTRAKKVAALERFNDRKSGRFVFLIGNRACTPIIRLSSVDAVIIYGSDWNPLSDLKALRKISITSHLNQIMVFRLYSSCTLEEKVLIFAKEDMVIENDTQNMNPSVSHSLLSWGASYLLDKLYWLSQHNNQNHDCSTSAEKLILNEVMRLLMQSPNMAPMSDNSNCSAVVKALHGGMRYSQNIFLPGERENTLSLDNDPLTFWSKLLGRISLQPKCIPGPSQGAQKKVHQLDLFATEPEVSGDELRKKCKIIDNSAIDSMTSVTLQILTQGKTEEAVMDKVAIASENARPSGAPTSQAKLGSTFLPCSGTTMNDAAQGLHMPPMSHNTADVDELKTIKLGEKGKWLNAQEDLLSSISPKLLKLCETLRLPNEVKHLAELFLLYIMENHHFSWGSETMLEGFIISLCWMAASFLKCKVNHKESLALAKKYLNFECKEHQVELVYAKLKFLKEKFSDPSSMSVNTIEPNSLLIETFLTRNDADKGVILEEISGQPSSNHHEMEKCETRECQSSILEKDAAKDFVHEVNLKKALFICEDLEECEIREGQSFEEQEEGEIREGQSFEEPKEGEIREGQSFEEPKEGEIREGRSTLLGKYSAIHIVYEDSSNTVSYNHEKMKEGEIRRDLSFVQEQNEFKHLIHEDNPKIISFDHEEIGEANIGVGQLSMPGNSDCVHETSPKLTSLDGELEKGETRKSTVGHMLSEQEKLVDRVGQSSVPGNDDCKDCLHETSSRITSLDGKLEEEIGKSFVACVPSEQPNLEEEQNSVMETPLPKINWQIKSLKDEILNKQILLIDKIHSVRMDELLLRQNLELDEFKKLRDEEEMELIKTHSLELDRINHMHIAPVVRDHKVKLLKQEFTKRKNEFNQHMKCQRRKFVVMLIEARNMEKQIRDRWLEEAKAGVLDNCFDKLPLSVTGFQLEKFKCEHYRHEGLVDNKTTTSSSSDLTRRPVKHFEPNDRPCSMSTCTNVVRSYEPSRPSSNISPIVQRVGVDTMPLKSVNPASHSNEMNATYDEFVGGPLQDWTKTSSSAHGSKRSGCDNSSSCKQEPPQSFLSNLNQVPSIGEWERSAMSMVGTESGDPSSSSPQSNVVPALCLIDAGTQQLGPNIKNLAVLDLLGLPPSVGLPGTPAPLGDQKPCNHKHCSTQLIEVSTQQPVVAAAAQPGQSNHKFSQCLRPSVGLTSGVHGHANMPAPVGSDQKPCNQIHCSAQLTEMSMRYPYVAAAGQLEQSRKPFSKPFVHPSPPTTNIPPTRTCTEYLSNTDVQPGTGNIFLQNFAMPQQEPHHSPLHDELMRLNGLNDSFVLWNKEKRLQLKLECDSELDKLRRKYDALIQDAEIKFADIKPRLDVTNEKIQKHLKLAEGFQEIFNEGAANAYQGACSSSTRQIIQVAQPQFPQSPVVATASRRAPVETNPPLSSIPLPLSSRLRPPPSMSASVPPVPEMQNSAAVFLNNPVRHPFSSMLHTRGDLQIRSIIRAPAPHLRTSGLPISTSNLHMESKRTMNQ